MPIAERRSDAGAMGIDATMPKDRPFPDMVTVPGVEDIPDF